MKTMKIKKNDTVRVLVGRDHGKQGKVTQVFPRQAMAVVEGLNLRTKHLKGRRGGQSGSKIQYAAPLATAKLMVVCPGCDKGTRIRVVTAADGKRTRTCHRCGQALI